jgi:hypothetical protein
VCRGDLCGDVYASRDGALENTACLSQAACRRAGLDASSCLARNRFRTQDELSRRGLPGGLTFGARAGFVSVERHPLPAEDLLAAAPPELLSLAQQLVQRWPLPMPGLHLIEFEVCPGLPCFDFRAYCNAQWQLTLPDAIADTAAHRFFSR